MNGQAIKEIVYILQETPLPNPVLQIKAADGCAFLPALAQLEKTDDLFNDQHSVIWFFDATFSAAAMYLQKNEEDLVQLTDNTFGTFYELGFFTNKFGEKAIGYLIDWSLVLNAHGPGLYRIRNSATKLIGTYPDQFSFEFQLKPYTAGNANNTVRAQWNRNGVLGNRFTDEKIDDYGTLNWLNQIRIPNSIFGFDTSNFTEEFIKYPNGQNVWLSDTQIEELTWNIYALPAYLHRFIQVDVIQSGLITFTDYNVLAPTNNVNRQCVPTAGYKPDWVVGVDKANVSITFKPYYENLTHLRE